MFGKLTWQAIPWDQPIPLFTAAVIGLILIAVLGFITLKGWVPYLWKEWITSVDHKRIGVMYCILALVMLLRGFSDALLMRSQQALAFHSPGYLPPEHYNQVFSAHGTIMIFFVAMPFIIGLMNFAVPLQLGVRDVALSHSEQRQLLADLLGCAAGQHEPGDRRVRPYGLAALSAAVGAEVLAWRGRRLLPRGAADIRGGDAAERGQPGHHHPEDACAGDELHPHADVLLDEPGVEPADRRRLPDPDRNLGHADAGPLPRLPLLHQRGRWERDDVHEPHLGLGASRGLHPDPARLWRVLRGGLDLLEEAAVRLPLDDRGHHGHLHPLLPGLAAPLLHHGRRGRRQRLLRHHPP